MPGPWSSPCWRPLLSGILAGLAPAWQCSRPNLTDALKEGGRGGSAGGARHRLRNILVAAEVALAVVLLVGAGLMVRGFRKLVENGATPGARHAADPAPGAHRQQVPRAAPAGRLLPRRAGRASARCPACASAAAVTACLTATIPTARLHHRRPARGTRPLAQRHVPGGQRRAISTRVHIPLRRGPAARATTTAPDAPKVALISERMARALVEERIAPRQAHPAGRRGFQESRG